MALHGTINWKEYRYADALGGIALLISLTAMLGWVLDIGPLKSVLPGSVTMKFNTALALLLAGIALLGAARGAHRGWRRASFCSLVLVVLISGMTLLEYVFDLQLGIDTLLMEDDPAAVATSHPGRMAPQTAVTLLLYALASLASSGAGVWRRRLSRLLLGAAFLVVLGALAGHLYGVQYFYGISQYTSMAIHTMAALFALCAGLYLVQQQNEPDTILFGDTSGGVTARRLLPAAILVPFIIGWLSLRGQLAGYYDGAATISTLVTAIILVLLLLVGTTVRLLHRLELQRRQQQQSTERALQELQQAHGEITTLKGMLPICAWCNKIRSAEGDWSDFATYLRVHRPADVSHGICPECTRQHFK